MGAPVEQRPRAGLRATLGTLREPRYAALSALMLVVAIGCVAAGTWQIARFDWKVRANDALTRNARAAETPVGSVLRLTADPTPSTDAVQFRRVVASGQYLTDEQRLVRLATIGNDTGYFVLTPLLTDHGTLLVVRGFVSPRADGSPPRHIDAPPAGTVTVRARVQPGESKSDEPAGIPAGQLASVNPRAWATRTGRPTYDGYVQLLKGQPGTAGLRAIPAPSLSNPAGGAVEPQHFAYIIQWYLFAALAIAAPFAMARADRREREKDADDEAAAAPPVEAVVDRRAGAPTDAQRRAAKLADRYGR